MAEMGTSSPTPIHKPLPASLGVVASLDCMPLKRFGPDLINVPHDPRQEAYQTLLDSNFQAADFEAASLHFALYKIKPSTLFSKKKTTLIFEGARLLATSPLRLGSSDASDAFTLVSPHDASFKISVNYYFYGRDFVMELLTSPQHEAEVLTSIISLFNSSSLVHSLLLNAACLDQLLQILKRSVLRPKKNEAINTSISEIWTNLCTPAFQAKVLEYCPEAPTFLLSLMVEDGMRHIERYPEIFDWISLGVGMPGEKQILLALLPLIEDVLGSLAGTNDKISTPSPLHSTRARRQSKCDAAKPKEPFLSHLVALLLYFNPNYASHVVTQESFMRLIAKIVEKPVLVALAPALSLLRWFGTNSAAVLKQYRILDILVAQAQLGSYGSRVLEVRTLLERFGQQLPLISLKAVLTALNGPLHPHLVSKFGRELVAVAKYGIFETEEELIELINKACELVCDFGDIPAADVLYHLIDHNSAKNRICSTLMIKTKLAQYYAEGLAKGNIVATRLSKYVCRFFRYTTLTPSFGGYPDPIIDTPPIESLGHCLQRSSFWKNIATALDSLEVTERSQGKGAPKVPSGLLASGQIDYYHWTYQTLPELLILTFSILAHATSDILEDIFLDKFFHSLERIMRHFELQSYSISGRVGLYIWYIYVMDHMFTTLEPTLPQPPTTKSTSSSTVSSSSPTSTSAQKSATPNAREVMAAELLELKRKFARFAQNPVCLEWDVASFNDGLMLTIPALDVQYAALFPSHEKWWQIVLRYTPYEPNLLGDSLHLATHLFGRDRAHRLMVPLLKDYYRHLPKIDPRLAVIADMLDFDRRRRRTAPTEVSMDTFAEICAATYVNLALNVSRAVSHCFTEKIGKKGQKVGAWLLWHFEMSWMLIDHEKEMPHRDWFMRSLKSLELALFLLLDVNHPNTKFEQWPKRCFYLLRYEFSLNYMPVAMRHTYIITRRGIQQDFLARLLLRAKTEEFDQHALQPSSTSSTLDSVAPTASQPPLDKFPPLFEVLSEDSVVLFLMEAFLHNRSLKRKIVPKTAVLERFLASSVVLNDDYDWSYIAAHALSLIFTFDSTGPNDIHPKIVTEILQRSLLAERRILFINMIYALLNLQGFRLTTPVTDLASKQVTLDDFPTDREIRFFVTKGLLRLLLHVIDAVVTDLANDMEMLYGLGGALNVLVIDCNEPVADAALDLAEAFFDRLSPAQIVVEASIPRQIPRERQWRYFTQYPSTKLPRWIKLQHKIAGFITTSSPNASFRANAVFICHILYTYSSFIMDCVADPTTWTSDQIEKLKKQREVMEPRWKRVIPCSLAQLPAWIAYRAEHSQPRWVVSWPYGMRAMAESAVIGEMENWPHLDFDLPLHLDWPSLASGATSAASYSCPLESSDAIFGVKELLKGIKMVLGFLPAPSATLAPNQLPAPTLLRGWIIEPAASRQPLESNILPLGAQPKPRRTTGEAVGEAVESGRRTEPEVEVEVETSAEHQHQQQPSDSGSSASPAESSRARDGSRRALQECRESREAKRCESAEAGEEEEEGGAFEGKPSSQVAGMEASRIFPEIELPGDPRGTLYLPLPPSWAQHALPQPQLPYIRPPARSLAEALFGVPPPPHASRSVPRPPPPRSTATNDASEAPHTSRARTFCQEFAKEGTMMGGILRTLGLISHCLCALPSHLLPPSPATEDGLKDILDESTEDTVLDIIGRLLHEGIDLRLQNPPDGILRLLQRFLQAQIGSTPSYYFSSPYKAHSSSADPITNRRNQVIVESALAPIQTSTPLPFSMGFLNAQVAQQINHLDSHRNGTEAMVRLETLFQLVKSHWRTFEEHLIPVFERILSQLGASLDQAKELKMRVVPFLTLYDITQDGPTRSAHFRSQVPGSLPASMNPLEMHEIDGNGSDNVEEERKPVIDMNDHLWAAFIANVESWKNG